MSGVSRGEQRRLYDARKRARVPEHGLRLVVIEKSVFLARAQARDLTNIREHFAVIEAPLGLQQRN